jgi:hypothetical protein
MSFQTLRPQPEHAAGRGRATGRNCKTGNPNTKIDFGVICGLRTMEEQRVLVDKGASKTMRSKHLDGKAVDLMAYIGSRGRGS